MHILNNDKSDFSTLLKYHITSSSFVLFSYCKVQRHWELLVSEIINISQRVAGSRPCYQYKSELLVAQLQFTNLALQIMM